MGTRLAVIGIVVAAFFTAAAAWAAFEGPHAELLPEEVVGVVLMADGETPVVSYPVRLWSADEERFLYRTRTDEAGVYRIPMLHTGRAYLLVGQVKIDLKVLAEEGGALIQRHDIIVVLPRRTLVGANQVLYEYFTAAVMGLPFEFERRRTPRTPEVVSP